ncbi:MAG: GNAT family N-acetyltransferase [Anaerolineae bacterium]
MTLTLLIKPLSITDAKQILQWRYDGDYRMYNLETDDLDAEAKCLTDPNNHFYGVYVGSELIGHAVFYTEARVPGGSYDADALDIGVGMRPDWTGQGHGAKVIAQILTFAKERYQPKAFRATIARWNHRAQKATQKNGFKIVSSFKATHTGKEFVILMSDS